MIKFQKNTPHEVKQSTKLLLFSLLYNILDFIINYTSRNTKPEETELLALFFSQAFYLFLIFKLKNCSNIARHIILFICLIQATYTTHIIFSFNFTGLSSFSQILFGILSFLSHLIGTIYLYLNESKQWFMKNKNNSNFTPADEINKEIEALNKLREKNIITVDEYKTLRKKIIDKF